LSQHFTVKDRNFFENTWVRENEKNIVPLLTSRLNIPRASTTPSAHNFPVITQHTQVLLGTEISLNVLFHFGNSLGEHLFNNLAILYTDPKE
jgi:hypothetical protein